MKHVGIVATTPEGAALCFRVLCQPGMGLPGPHDRPEVTLDCIALARRLSSVEGLRLLDELFQHSHWVHPFQSVAERLQSAVGRNW